MTTDEKAMESYFEKKGWLRKVAGETDFTNAVKTFAMMRGREGLGVLICGCYGSGKTKLVNIFADYFGCENRVRLGIRSEREKFDDKYIEYHCSQLYDHNVLVDDLGAEEPINEYGVRIESAADFIVKFHASHQWATEKADILPKDLSTVQIPRLLITTNLSITEIDARYGGRVVSRLKDLCIPLPLTGEDKRKWRTVS